MFCAKCGNPLEEGARFCKSCGAAAQNSPAQPWQPQPVGQQAPPQPVGQPAYPPPATPSFQYAQPSVPPTEYKKPRKKRHIGCLIVLILFLALVGTGLYFIARFSWLPPRDLGVDYTDADFERAMDKIGMQISFMGESGEGLKTLIEEHRDERLAIDDYNWTFSNYEERSFELTPQEATAFINEIAPPFSWFEDAQMKVFPDGHSAGSYKVRFDKIKQELIPDIAGQIPDELARLLPDTFNLYMEGDFEIRENEVYVPDKLARLEAGDVPLQPVIGDLSDSDRDVVFDYAERIYKQIPDLMIHTLKINAEGNFEVDVYMPTQVTVTKK